MTQETTKICFYRTSGPSDVPPLQDKMLQHSAPTRRLTTCRQRVSRLVRCPSENPLFLFPNPDSLIYQPTPRLLRCACVNPIWVLLFPRGQFFEYQSVVKKKNIDVCLYHFGLQSLCDNCTYTFTSSGNNFFEALDPGIIEQEIAACAHFVIRNAASSS